MDGTKEFLAGADDEGRRLDRVLRRLLGKASLSLVYSSLRKGHIKVNGRKARPDQLLGEGDRIEIASRLAEASDGARHKDGAGSPEAEAALAPLVIARGPDLLVLDKPRGMLTHGDASLDSLVRGACAGSRRDSLAFTPGPLHRLDRNTSGIVVFSLSIAGAREFTEALREGRVAKYYLALLSGSLEARADWEDLLERDEDSLSSHVSARGQVAKTSLQPLAGAEGLTLSVIRLATGRTHQIRAQCAHHGFPLSGDAKYGDRRPGPYFLHAWRLDFLGTRHEALPPVVEAPIPDGALARLRTLWDEDSLSEALSRGRAWAGGDRPRAS